MKKKLAFTLAEVLITLTILGVVAAIAVPSLQKQNYKRTQITRMAKAYAALENAAQNIATNTNCIGKDITCTGLTKITDSKELQKKFIELSGFRVPKSYAGLWYVACEPLNYKNLSYSKTDKDGDSGRYPVFYTTPDNIAYFVESTAIGDSQDHPKERFESLHVVVFTDKLKLYDKEGNIIDAAKGRTNAVQGRDVFHFAIYKNFQVEPLILGYGGAWHPLSLYGKSGYVKSQCDPNAKEKSYWQGMSCTARIIRDGWKMNY